MGDPRELEWAKKPDALKESWTARIGTHVYTEFPLHNAWLGGYSSIVREMLPDKFDFLLDEMIRLRNAVVLIKLEKDGHNPSIL